MEMKPLGGGFYVGDDGRAVYNVSRFSADGYYVPFEEIPALKRRLYLVSGLLIVPLLAVLLFSTQLRNPFFWLFLAYLLPLPLAPLLAHSVRSRYEPVRDPAAQAALRRAVFLKRRPGQLRVFDGVLACGWVLTAPPALRAVAMTAVLVVIGTGVFEMIVHHREERAILENENTIIA